MRGKTGRLRFQIFGYMAAIFFLWFALSTALSEFMFYLEERRGFEFPFRYYVFLTLAQVVLLVLMNIPFLLFLIGRVDRPVRKIVESLNRIAEGKYDEKIDFESRNEFDEIKDAFNSMSEKLEAAEKVKRNAENERILLFANMAHDLKTPITSILGFSRALSDGLISDEARKSEYLATIGSKAEKMNGLIDRLFEYVKLESAENLLDREDCDVAEVLRNCLADVYAEYEEKEIALEIEIPETPVVRSVDKVELSRVYTNLLDNVLKHNAGGIRVLVRMGEDGGVLVADSGGPLPAAVKDSLFMPFVSGDKSRSSKSGSGLGLALAAKIMRRHGGSLRLVEDVPGFTKGFSAEF